MNSLKPAGLIFIIIVISCKAPVKDSGKIPEIEVQAALSVKEQIKLSEFLTKIDYIRLETSTDGLVRPNSRVIITDKYIIIISSRQCLLFERKSGKFIREIGKYGRGPGEYAVATQGFFVNNQSVIYFMGWDNSLIGYSFNGNVVGTITLPDTESSFVLGNLSYLNDSVFVLHHMNATGNEKTLLTFFDNPGKVLWTIPNPYREENHPLTVITHELRFHRFRNTLHYSDRYNDTVFSIKQDTILPHFILNRGEARPPYESRLWDFEKRNNRGFIMHPIYMETGKYILGTIIVNEKKHFLLHKKSGYSKISIFPEGLINDIDGSMPFEFTNINNEGTELACIMEPGEILAWISSGKDRIANTSPEFLSLGNIKPDDNPVVIIGYVK